MTKSILQTSTWGVQPHFCPLLTQSTGEADPRWHTWTGHIFPLNGLFACSANVLEAQLCLGLRSEQIQWLWEDEAGPLPSWGDGSVYKYTEVTRAAWGRGAGVAIPGLATGAMSAQRWGQRAGMSQVSQQQSPQ